MPRLNTPTASEDRRAVIVKTRSDGSEERTTLVLRTDGMVLSRTDRRLPNGPLWQQDWVGEKRFYTLATKQDRQSFKRIVQRAQG